MTDFIKKILTTQHKDRDEAPNSERFENRLESGKQDPHIMSIECADSYCLGAFEASGQKIAPNDVFTRDSAGNVAVVGLYDSVNESWKTDLNESVAYWADHIVAHGKGTYVLVVQGHTMCGAIGAVIANYDDKNALAGERLSLQQHVTHIKDGVIGTLEKTTNEENATYRNALVAQANVDFQIEEAIKLFPNMIEKGQLVVLGMMRDLTGDVYSSDTKRYGDVFITNVNGKNSINEITSHPYLVELGLEKEVLEHTIQRINFKE